MSSVNPYYTLNYSQPEEYRLSHDSVFLARQVFERIEALDLSMARGLDICSGAGVVGMDFLFHRRQHQQSLPQAFDFLDVQEVYRPHFEENKIRLGPLSTELHFLHRNYNELQSDKFQSKYDLILSAPPYFLPSQGKLSPSEFKNRCRFFIDSDLKNLLLGIHHSLKPTGIAFILLRDLPEHKINVIEEAQQICSGLLNFSVLGEIRGTHFIQMSSAG